MSREKRWILGVGFYGVDKERLLASHLVQHLVFLREDPVQSRVAALDQGQDVLERKKISLFAFEKFLFVLRGQKKIDGYLIFLPTSLLKLLNFVFGQNHHILAAA
jgi:hypothetical protein